VRVACSLLCRAALAAAVLAHGEGQSRLTMIDLRGTRMTTVSAARWCEVLLVNNGALTEVRVFAADNRTNRTT
jgi:hypothetical protein